MVETNNVAELEREQIDSLEIKLRKVSAVPGCLVVSMKGYIDTYNSPHFRKQVDKAVDAGYVRLIFEFSGINYISSTGIGAFTTVLKNVKPRGGDIVLVGLRSSVFEVFQLLGFSHFFNVEDTLDEAVRLFTAQSESANGGPFPKVFACPICGKRLRASKEGRFRCPECKTILVIDTSGQVSSD